MRKALPFQHQALERAQVASKAVAVFLSHFVARGALGCRSASFGLPSTALGGLLFNV
jgi:hypothetical protein